MMDFMMDEGARPISEDDILKELAKTEEGRRLLEEVMASELGGESVGGGGELGQLAGIGQQSLPPQQPEPQPPQPFQPTNREFDKFPPGLGNDGTDPVPQDVSNMSPYGSLQGAESVGADETHTMPDGTVHPYSTHEEMMEALSRKQGIGGAELVGADPRGTRLGRGQY
jgi:hypothetical protein